KLSHGIRGFVERLKVVGKITRNVAIIKVLNIWDKSTFNERRYRFRRSIFSICKAVYNISDETCQEILCKSKRYL
ncbi:PIPO, partial [Papaya leaf distortion mosaic virus]|uniref:PIPO n=1 Tax=Papaya leaf distortion mosaic virus TaxID=46917 RepID=UPI0002651314